MDSQSLMCLDWILASTEYIEFVYMMLEFKVGIYRSFAVRERKTGTEKITNTMLGKPTSMAAKTRRTTRLEEGHARVELLVKLNCAVMMI